MAGDRGRGGDRLLVDVGTGPRPREVAGLVPGGPRAPGEVLAGQDTRTGGVGHVEDVGAADADGVGRAEGDGSPPPCTQGASRPAPAATPSTVDGDARA